MGTRHLICAVLDGEYKLSQYGQWDGYFSGQGKDIVEFITKVMKIDLFKAELKKLRYMVDGDWDQINKDLNITPKDGHIGFEESNRINENYPEVCRRTGSKILLLIQLGKARFTKEYLGFAKNGLFCEFCYVLDMDHEILEIYVGYGKEPIGKEERFYSDGYSNDGYYPVKCFKKIPFSELTETTMKELDQELYPDEDDD